MRKKLQWDNRVEDEKNIMPLGHCDDDDILHHMISAIKTRRTRVES
jgi:hypothetical protein